MVLAATIGAVALFPRVWTAKADFILPNATSNLDANLGTLGSLSNGNSGFSTQVNPLQVQSSIMLSNSLLDQVREIDPEKDQLSRLGNYRGLFQVTPQEQSTIISLAVQGSSQEVARQRAIAFAQAYQKRLNQLRRDDAAAREQFSQDEFEQARQNLLQAQSALAVFKKSSGLVDGEEQTGGIVAAISSLTTAQAQASAEAQSNETQAKALTTRLGQTPDQAIRSLRLGENQAYEFTRQKLSEIEAALIEARAQLTDRHPRVRALLSRRQELRRQMAQQISAAAANLPGVDLTVDSSSGGRIALIQQLILAESASQAQRSQANQLRKQIDGLSGTLGAIPEKQARVLELQRQYEITEGVYKGLVAKVQQSKIDAFNTYPNVQLLDPPTVGRNPSSPKWSLAALGGILASAFGSIALALLLESRNPLLRPKDLQGAEFPIVMRIPRLRRSAIGFDLSTEAEVEFQRLGSAISLLALENRRLLITSATLSEGKTTVTLGLATALLELGFRVLVVDGDFRRAELSRRLGYVKGPADPLHIPIQVQPGLDLLPTLPRQSKVVELVARGRFEQYLADAEVIDRYDYVLIDSAPVGLTSETAWMAAAAINVLFVVRPSTSDRNSVRDSLEQLAQHNAQVVGLAINGVETGTSTYRYQISSVAS